MKGQVIFTTARIRAGEIVHEALHHRRLFRDATFIAPTLVPAISEAMEKAREKASDLQTGSIRVSLGETTKVTTSIERREEWKVGDEELAIDLAPDPRSGSGLWVKCEDRAALSTVPSDALLYGPHAELREGTWFSVAFHREGEWVLPPLGPGVLFGTTREWFAKKAGARASTLGFEALSDCSGALALSSLLGVAPIASIAGQRVNWSKTAKAGAHSLAVAHLE